MRSGDGGNADRARVDRPFRDFQPSVCETPATGVYRGMTSDPSLDEHFIDVQAGCWTPVFRFALALTNDWDAAEDIAQEAFARLWIHRDSIDWSRPALPWLLTTTRHIAFDRFRRIRRAMARASSTPLRGLDGDERVAWLDVQAAMAALGPLDRAALTMVAIGGLSYDEVAEALGTTAGAVRARVSRARRELAERIR
jgi:RNA polymerase sigma-70 factor (ECF subfamily)